jgi:hypothetical protein
MNVAKKAGFVRRHGLDDTVFEITSSLRSDVVDEF